MFFDDRGVPLLHVVNALLGYQGAGSALSHRIMRDLGLSESVFTEINTLVNNQDYVVVLTREQYVEKNGVMHALPMMVSVAIRHSWADVSRPYRLGVASDQH